MTPLPRIWALSYQSTMKKMLPQISPKGSLMKAIPQVWIPLLGDSTLCEDDKNLINSYTNFLCVIKVSP